MNPVTETERAAFLDGLRACPNATVAAKRVGRSPSTFAAIVKRDEGFARDVQQAMSEGRDHLEAEAHRRAYAGVEKPVYYKGEIVGHVTEYSDRLLEFLLTGAFPEKYSKKIDLHKTVVSEQGFGTDNELARRIAFLLQPPLEAIAAPVKEEKT